MGGAVVTSKRCTYCSEPATTQIVARRQCLLARTEVCGTCAVAHRAEPMTLGDVERKDEVGTLDRGRRRRTGGRGRFAQG